MTIGCSIAKRSNTTSSHPGVSERSTSLLEKGTDVSRKQFDTGDGKEPVPAKRKRKVAFEDDEDECLAAKRLKPASEKSDWHTENAVDVEKEADKLRGTDDKVAKSSLPTKGDPLGTQNGRTTALNLILKSAAKQSRKRKMPLDCGSISIDDTRPAKRLATSLDPSSSSKEEQANDEFQKEPPPRRFKVEAKAHPSNSLLGLPRELQDMIFNQVYPVGKTLELTNRLATSGRTHSPGLFRVCRELYDITMPEFYNQNWFCLGHPASFYDTSDRPLWQTLEMIGRPEYLRLARGITICVPQLPNLSEDRMLAYGFLKPLSFSMNLLQMVGRTLQSITLKYSQIGSGDLSLHVWPRYHTYKGPWASAIEDSLGTDHVMVEVHSIYGWTRQQVSTKGFERESKLIMYDMLGAQGSYFDNGVSMPDWKTDLNLLFLQGRAARNARFATKMAQRLAMQRSFNS
ncbi:hypothetical protein LTS18_012604 [Coniosporium uncinatum]|uniref:Uncharacterized protein n=1 Tax=Coniosporium uncinatum TaxID=93489 RepID=A0ACC3DW77_9PEZI|nr:hypothetical protein LTS18_012604 [Coniosporium uncinatum]